MSCGIYQIKNLIDEKRYIGQSVNIERRWKDHKKSINSMTHSYNNPLYRLFENMG